MYCQHCGTKLSDVAKFCPGCGNQVERPEQPESKASTRIIPKLPEQEPPQVITPKLPEREPVVQGERALMVLNVSRKDGLLKRTMVHMVFFRDTLVLAELTAERQRAETQAVSAKLKEEKTGFFKGSMAMMDYWANYGSKYYHMTPAEILAEERTNMEIAHRDINRFVFSRMESRQDQNSTTQTGGDLEVQHRLGKIKASHKYGDGNQNVKKVLESLYGGNLKYKGSRVIFSFGNREGFI
jgi:hypothetical protein